MREGAIIAGVALNLTDLDHGVAQKCDRVVVEIDEGESGTLTAPWVSLLHQIGGVNGEEVGGVWTRACFVTVGLMLLELEFLSRWEYIHALFTRHQINHIIIVNG
jgi:hypothetical protein